MDLRKLHLPSVGVTGLLLGGLLRALAVSLAWPFLLVALSNVVLLIAVVWIVLFDLFPLFLEPFYFIRKRFSKRRSLFVALLILFVILRVTTDYLPSSTTKDIITTLAFLSFASAVIWFVASYVLSNFTPLVRYMKRKPREAESVTYADLITSLAIVFAPAIVLSFIFTPTGLNQTIVTPSQIFVLSLLTDIVMAGYLYLFIIKPKIFTWKRLGLRKVDHEDIGQALLLFFYVSLAIIAAQYFLRQVGLPLESYSFATKDGAWLAFVATVFIGPFIEELYFRGFLFRGLLAHNSLDMAYLTSSLLFALLHPPLVVMVESFFIGLLLAYVLKQTKSIWPGVLIHMLNNALIMWYLLFR